MEVQINTISIGTLDTALFEASVPKMSDLRALFDLYGYAIDFNGGILVWVPKITAQIGKGSSA